MSSKTFKPVPNDWIQVLDSQAIERALTRMSYEILEKGSADQLAVIGIKTGGEFLGRRLHAKLKEIEAVDIPFGVLDITLYRDDLFHVDTNPEVKGSDLPFSLNKKRIILVDDILYTGRTIRAALDALIDFGRPGNVELAVLADRGHREFPIRPDYVGKNIPTERKEFIRLRLEEMEYEDSLYLIRKA